MTNVLIMTLCIFPYGGIRVGVGKWFDQSSSYHYRPISHEFSVFVGGWPVVGNGIKDKHLLLLEGGYHITEKKTISLFVPENSQTVSFTDLYFSFHALRELRRTPSWKLLAGGGISWHTLRCYSWMNSTHQLVDTGSRAGFSLDAVLSIPINAKVGVIIWLKHSQVFPWLGFDFSMVRVSVGLYQDFRRVASRS